jgi:transposase InsO family protein
VIDCCTREIVGWNLSHRCRTEEAVAAVEQAVLDRLPAGSRETDLTLTTDNGTQFTPSRFMETLAQLGITHRPAYHHPEGNSCIERFHRSLKGGGSLDFGISQPDRSQRKHRPVSLGVQSRPPASRSQKPHSARGILGFCSSN